MACLQRVVHDCDGVADVRRHPWRVLVQIQRCEFVGIDREPIEHLREYLVGVAEHHVEFLAEDLGIGEVLHPEPDPHRLVGVRRADTPLSRAEFAVTEVPFVQGIELLVVRHDQVGIARDLQGRAVDATARQHVHFGEEHLRVDDDAVADDRGDVVVENSTRNQLEGEALTVDHQGVAGVVTALIADDQLHLLGNEVGELSLPLVAPLSTDDDGRRHGALLSQVCVTPEG